MHGDALGHRQAIGAQDGQGVIQVVALHGRDHEDSAFVARGVPAQLAEIFTGDDLGRIDGLWRFRAVAVGIEHQAARAGAIIGVVREHSDLDERRLACAVGACKQGAVQRSHVVVCKADILRVVHRGCG